MADTPRPNEEYNRFETEMAEAEKKGEDAICDAVKRGFRSVNESARETKKMIVLRGAEAIKPFVPDPSQISRILGRRLTRSERRYIRRWLPDEYKSSEHQGYARLRKKTEPELSIGQAATWPLTYDTRPLKSGSHKSTPVVPGKVITAGQQSVLNSSVGSLGDQVATVQISFPPGGGYEVTPLDDKSIGGLSGMKVISAVIPKSEVERLAMLEAWSSGYRILERSSEYTDFITITPPA